MNGLNVPNRGRVLRGAVLMALVLGAARPGAAQRAPALTAADRAAIQQLSATYAEVLGACKAEEYAALFAPDGYFASGFRGRVQGREPLIALVRSERHCIAVTPRAASGVPVMTIEGSTEGATGKAMLANNGGAYEDVYVRTPAGWRFRSRTHVTMKELAARDAAAALPSLSPLDYVEIRQLVARYAYAVDTGAESGNVYASLFAPGGAFVDRAGREITGPDALAALARRNTRGPQSAFHFIVNHIIEPSPEGAVGKQFLLQLRIGDGDRPNDIFGGGHYEDVYVKTETGWRFKRRQYVPSEGTPASLRGGANR